MADAPPGQRAPGDRVPLRCESCLQFDTHPRHHVITALDPLQVTSKHFDCCRGDGCEGGTCASVLLATRGAHGDALTAWLEGRMAALGGELTAWIAAGCPVMGGASGMDQNRLNDFLAVTVGQSANVSSPFTAVLTNPFSASSSQLGHIRIITTATPSTSTTNGSELAGGSYVGGTGINFATGSSGAFTAPVFNTLISGESATQNNTLLQQTGMPAANIGGIEIWDSKGTSPAYAASLRWWWAQLSSPVSTNNGDTLQFNATAITAALYGPGQT